MSEPWLTRIFFGVIGLLVGAIPPLALADAARFVKQRGSSFTTVLLVPLRFIGTLLALSLCVGALEWAVFWVTGAPFPEPPALRGDDRSTLGSPEYQQAVEAGIESLDSFMVGTGTGAWLAVGSVVGFLGGLLLIWLGMRRGWRSGPES